MHDDSALLDQEVLSSLAGRRFQGPWHAYSQIGSTNARLLELAKDGAPEGCVVSAETQTAGRGRCGRQWISPEGLGLYISVLLRPPSRVVHTLPLIGSLAVATTVEPWLNVSTRLRWPNDVHIDERKIAGVLAEYEPHSHGLVLGIGINVLGERSDWPEGATTLSTESSQSVTRIECARALLINLELEYERWLTGGWAACAPAFRQRVSLVGEIISVTLADSIIEGVMQGIDESGALLLRLDGGTLWTIHAGDVRLVRPTTGVNP